VIPTITSVSPSSFPTNANSVAVTVNGTNFQQGVSVYFNGFPFNPTSESPSQLTVGLFNLPSQPGTYPLYVADPAPAGTSAPFSLTVTVPPDFSLSPQVSAVTVTAGIPAKFPLNTGTAGGFSGTVTVACGDSAPASTCSANPNMVNAGGGTMITVNTTSRGALAPGRETRRFLSYELLPFVVLALMLWALAALRLMPVWQRRWSMTLPLLALALYLVLQAAGCGGGGSGGGPSGGRGGGQPPGTPAGNYTITISGTSGNTTHQVTVPLTVN